MILKESVIVLWVMSNVPRQTLHKRKQNTEGTVKPVIRQHTEHYSMQHTVHTRN